jgi:WD40 repeat protein
MSPLRSAPGTRYSTPNRRYSSPSPSSLGRHSLGGTPLSSSASPVYSDRFIPSRRSSNLEEAYDNMEIADSTSNAVTMVSGDASDGSAVADNQETYNSMLRAELLGQGSSSMMMDSDVAGHHASQSSKQNMKANVLKYTFTSSPSHSSRLSFDRNGLNLSPCLSSSPSSKHSPGGLNEGSSSRKATRKISKVPYKILDAPSLCDDFYLNLVDWSATNVLSVALGNSVYLWSACTSKITQLCDLTPASVTSLTWSERGNYLAVGSASGQVSIWDVTAQKKVREMQSHASRVGVMTWNSSLLATGSRDRHIYVHDIRIRNFSDNSSASASASTSTRMSRSPSTEIWPPSMLSQPAPISSMPLSLFSDPSLGMPNLRDDIFASVDAAAAVSAPPARDPCIVYDFNHHKQEVCGLKWSFDEKYLASGGNDNKLFVWSANHGHSAASTAASMSSHPSASMSSSSSSSYQPTSNTNPTTSAVSSTSDNCSPLYEFSDHLAAVKAVAWSPHQHGLLASGGGTADRHIRFWNAVSGQALHKIDTGSQVCNLLWSKNVNELVSTHGYSLNQVIIWKYPSMQKLATLTGHTLRVLYLAGSPDGQSIVTGAGDETLRFWNVFPGPRNRANNKLGPSVLIPAALDMR